MEKIIYDKYLINDQGVIKNYNNGKLLKIKFNPLYELYSVKLYVGSKRKTFYLHILLIETFFEGFNKNLDKIVFKDSNKKNYHLDNLKVYRLCEVFPNNQVIIS